MNLENQLKHYLPYNLKCEILDYKSDYVGDQYETIKGYYLLNDKAYFNFKSGRDYAGKNTTQFKPILRPLSDLTKEINVNNEDFVPYEHSTFVEAMLANEYLEYLCEAKADLSEDRLLPYSIVQLLFEWHFDVFGLIEKGIAIDINDVSLAEC